MDARNHTPGGGGGHGASTFGERWGQLSVGAEPPAASEERGPLPAGWGAPTAQQRPRPPPPQQQQHVAVPRAPSDQGDKPSSEGGSSGAKSVSTEVTARAGGSEDLGVLGMELTPAFGMPPQTGLEEAVSREVAARMVAIEDKFGAMFGRLEGLLLDAQKNASSSAKGVAGVAAAPAVSDSADSVS